MTGPCRDRWLIEDHNSSGAKRLFVVDGSKTQYYFCIDDDGKGIHLKKFRVCDMNQVEPVGDFRIFNLNQDKPDGDLRISKFLE